MNFKGFTLMAIILYCTLYARAQAQGIDVIESIIESLADKAEEDMDYADLTERLMFYQRHPMNINKVDAHQLSELMFLTPLQINSLLSHIRENGDVIELTELQSITGFDLETYRKLIPFISLGTHNSLINISLRGLSATGEHDVMLRFGQLLQTQQGYHIPDSSDKSRYLGSPSRVLLRYRYNYGQNLTVSLNMDKDAGEQFVKGKRLNGFDFYSGNIFFKNAGRFVKIAVGDYLLQFGQGLSLWSGMGIGKGAEVAATAKQDMGLRPYTSSNEALYFRGTAATVKLANLLYTPFISYVKLDGNLSESTEIPQITSIGISGLHRTPTEQANKSSVSQLVFGNALQYDGRMLDIGITAYHTAFNHLFEKGRLLYNRFDFSGDRLTNAGVNYNYTINNTYFFGEAAHSLGGGYAFLNGVLTSLSPKVSTVFLHRNYGRNYHSFYNQAFSEGTAASNEKGFYSGLVVKPYSKTELTTYLDVFSFPWMKFRADAPSNGYEVSSQLVYSYSKTFRVTARYRFQLKEENDDVEETVNMLEAVKKQNFRFDLNYKIGKDFMVRNRAELSQYQKGNAATENGYMLYQDVIYNPMQSRFSGNFRFAIFDTPGFNSRIYAYENDVLYSYSSPAYQNSGLRFYVNGRYTLKKGLDIWARYSTTSYADLDEIGSGLDMIEGNEKSDIKLQIRYQF